MIRTHDAKCRCAPCRHKRFTPGAPSTSRKARRGIGHKDKPRHIPHTQTPSLVPESLMWQLSKRFGFVRE